MTNLQDFKNRSEVGTIKPWGKATAPSGYLLCDGTAVSRTTYAELYVVLGDTYGAGNGSTTFNVPQLQGKTPQGYDGNTYNLAGTGGANTVTVSMTNNQGVSVTGNIANTSLTTAQLASHNHTLSLQMGRQSMIGGPYIDVANQTDPSSISIGNAGSGTGHTHTHTLTGTLTGSVNAAGTNSFSPYVVVNYIIKH